MIYNLIISQVKYSGDFWRKNYKIHRILKTAFLYDLLFKYSKQDKNGKKCHWKFIELQKFKPEILV